MMTAGLLQMGIFLLVLLALAWLLGRYMAKVYGGERTLLDPIMRPLERAIFLGGQAYDKRLCQALARQLALPAQIGDPLAGIPREPDALAPGVTSADGSLPDWAVAAGLSLGSAAGAKAAGRQEEVVRV